MHATIIIGYDGSSRSGAALHWALDEAVRAGAPAELLYADDYPVWAPAPAPVRPQSYVEDVIEGMLKRAVEDAGHTHPLAQPTWTVLCGHPVACLISRSESARMLVVGGHGGLGSVGASVSAHARCPVVVVRGATGRAGPVVAGVDDSALAPAVLAFAAEQAAGRKAPLHVLRTWRLRDRTEMNPGEVTGHERASFDALVAVVRDAHPDLRIEAEARVEHPAAALTTASTTAQLLVVGSRGRGAVRGLLLGSVSRHLLRHAGCPVAVVPHTAVPGAQPAPNAFGEYARLRIDQQ